jgi:hypothetical protein
MWIQLGEFPLQSRMPKERASGPDSLQDSLRKRIEWYILYALTPYIDWPGMHGSHKTSIYLPQIIPHLFALYSTN